MRRIILHVMAKGHTVVDLTEPGWVLNAKNCANLVGQLRASDCTGKIAVMDLFGNTSCRYRQADDGLAMAVKMGGGGGTCLAMWLPHLTL